MSHPLAWPDLQTLALLAAEKADDRALTFPERERLADLSDRVLDGSASAADLREVAALAEVDAALQRDAIVRKRYLALAQRALEASA